MPRVDPPHPTIPTPPRQNHWPILFALFLVVLIAFSRLFKAEFSLLDDPFNIALNPQLNPPAGQPIDFGYFWKTQEQYGLYIPFTYTIWGLLAMIARVPPDPDGISLNPYVFHSANILLHACSVMLVYAILIRLLHRRWPAAMGALLFAVHPVQVEAVAWAAGMKDVLSGMLSLLAIWQYLWFAQNPLHRRARVRYAIALIAFILAMLSKPSAMMTPVILLAIDWLLIKRPIKRVVIDLAPWFVLALACAINARIAQPGTGVPAAPLWARPLIVGDSIAFYLYKLVWPVKLGLDYGHRPSAVMTHGWIYLTWILPAVIGTFLVRGRKRFPELLVAAIVFVAATAPVLGAVTFLYQFFSTTADHYVYLAMLGPALALGWLMSRYAKAPAIAGVSLVLLILTIGTMLQSGYWLSDFSLFHHALNVNPNSVLSMNNLGNAYFHQRDLDHAEALFRGAVETQSDQLEAHQNLANVLRARGNLDEAIEHDAKAIQILLARPKSLQGPLVSAYVAAGQDLLDGGRFPEARDHFKEALKLKPDRADAQKGLQTVEEKLKE